MILTSEGVRDAAINEAEGEKQRVIKASEASQQQQINEANGQAAAILAIASATAEGLRQVSGALSEEGGDAAMKLRIAEQYVAQFGALAKEGNTLIILADISNLASMVALATRIGRETTAQENGA